MAIQTLQNLVPMGEQRQKINDNFAELDGRTGSLETAGFVTMPTMNNALSGKQDKLTAGTGVSIDAANTISVSGMVVGVTEAAGAELVTVDNTNDAHPVVGETAKLTAAVALAETAAQPSDVSDAIDTHNAHAGAHGDIRDAIPAAVLAHNTSAVAHSGLINEIANLEEALSRLALLGQKLGAFDDVASLPEFATDFAPVVPVKDDFAFVKHDETANGQPALYSIIDITGNAITWEQTIVFDADMSNKMDYITGGTVGNLPMITGGGALEDSGVALDEVMPKVESPVVGNIPIITADGTLEDSGKTFEDGFNGVITDATLTGDGKNTPLSVVQGAVEGAVLVQPVNTPADFNSLLNSIVALMPASNTSARFIFPYTARQAFTDAPDGFSDTQSSMYVDVIRSGGRAKVVASNNITGDEWVRTIEEFGDATAWIDEWMRAATVKDVQEMNTFVTVPDYANMETVNRMSVNNGTWTVDRIGYVYIGASDGGGAQTDLVITVNGKEVCLGNSAGASKIYGTILQVNIGDALVVTTNMRPSSNKLCFFIPPKYLWATAPAAKFNVNLIGQPDYAKMGPNLVTSNNWTYTVPQDGYALIGVNEGGWNLTINGQLIREPAASPGTMHNWLVYQLSAGDVVNMYFPSASMGRFRFIPPVTVAPMFITGADLQGTDKNGRLRIDPLTKEGIINDNYSTTEQDTGKTWIDGKPIFRRVVQWNNPTSIPATTWVSLNTNIGEISTLTDYSISVRENNATGPGANTRLNLTSRMQIGVSALGDVWFYVISLAPIALVANTATVTLEYTKA